MNTSKKILCFSPYAFWQLHALYEIAICHNLQARGHPCSFVTCDLSLSQCDLFWWATVGPRPANACHLCRQQVQPMLQHHGFPSRGLGTYAESGDSDAAQALLESVNDDDLLAATFQGHPIGQWVKSSVHSHLRINTIVPADPLHRATVRGYLRTGVLALLSIKRMLAVEKPAVLLLFNGRMAVPRIALELAKQSGIRVVCHERGLARETLLLWENETCLSQRPYARLWEEWGEVPLQPPQVERVTRWLLDRAGGRNLNWTAFSRQDAVGTLGPFLKRHEGRQVWSLFTSSTDEIVAEPEHTSAFGTQDRWVEETVRWVAKQERVALVIRVHPNSGGRKSTGRNEGELQFYQRLGRNLPSNVALVMPDDAVSTYALIERSALGLVYGSTVALEMACRGKKVLLAARTRWQFCGGIEFISDASRYPALLAGCASRSPDRAEAERMATAAFRFGYAYMERWHIRFPIVHMPDIHHGVLAVGADALRPGQHDYLDYAGDIVVGCRPSVPISEPAARTRSAEEERAAVRAALDQLAGSRQPETPLRISVVITCYNYAKYLRECVRSVAEQTFRDFEVVIVNDGSTDESAAVSEACRAEFGQVAITVINQPNSGQPALARNAGIRAARGEFILPLDADDQIDPGYLQACVARIAGDAAIDLVYSDSLFVKGTDRTRKTPGRFEVDALKRCNQLVYCCLYRRRVWETVGGYRDNIRGYEDWDFWLAAALAGARGAYVPCVGLIYNDKDGGVFSQTVGQHRLRTAQLVLNNPAAFAPEQLQQARALLGSGPAARTQPAGVGSAARGKPPTVSVVVPCYRQAQYLPEAIQSVIEQTYDDWELIMVNDGSPDDTGAIARALIEAHPDRRLRLIDKANGGLADARNAGIQFARGRYILPLDADDRICPTLLAKGVALLESDRSVSIAYCDWEFFGAQAGVRQAHEYDFKLLCEKQNLFTCTSLFRREAWDAAGGYNRNMTHGIEDWDFWVGCGEHGHVGRRIPEVLFQYRVKPGSMLQNLQSHLPAMFARLVMNHPQLYGPRAVEHARTTFASAGLPPPRPAAAAREWLPPAAIGGAAPASFTELVGLAQRLVVAGRKADAIAALQEALRRAPSPAARENAAQILTRLEQTAGAVLGPVFLDGHTAAQLPRLVARYEEAPMDDTGRAAVLRVRAALVHHLQNSDAGVLQAGFGGDMGKAFQILRNSGIVSELATQETAAEIARLDDVLRASARSPACDVPALLARMLLAPAHRGGVSIAVEKVPGWLIDEYLAYVLHAPATFVVHGEAEVYHEHMLGWARLIAERTRTAPRDPLTIKTATFFTLKNNAIPLYFSAANTREFAIRRAEIIEFMLRHNGAAIDAPALARRKPGSGRLRVGFVNMHFGAQTETHVTLPMLQLDRRRFEVRLFAVAANPGAIEQRCRSFADAFTVLPAGLAAQVKTIREAALDVVVVGTNVTAVTNQVTLIASHRLAPVQLVSYCSPVTTGIRHMDGYLTGTFAASAGMQEHFSERLYVTDGPPGCLDYSVEAAAGGRAFDRAGLGLRPDEVVFVNAAACFKILPELQESWAKILARVPHSRLLLLPFNPNWSNAFPAKQFERSLASTCARHGVARDRLVLAGALPSRADVKAVERIADVYLDTFPFSGSISVIDPLELGIPTVIWEGATHRGRMAAALLRELELPDLIAADEPAYIARAVQLGTDPTERARVGEQIRAAMDRKPRFLNAAAYAAQFGTVLETIVRERRLPNESVSAAA